MDGSGSLDLKFVTHGQYSDNVGSRVYLLDEGGKNYYMFRLTIRYFGRIRSNWTSLQLC